MPSIDYESKRSALYTPGPRPTLFVAGATYSAEQIGIEAARLAYVKAESSDADRVSLTEALSRIGFAAPTLFNNAPFGAQAFGAYRPVDGLALIAFRGTQPESLTDIGVDLEADTLPWIESAGRVHRGFALSARAVFPDIGQWLTGECHGRSGLVLCGHSLGAALATLAATVWKPTLLLTIGSPRVGNGTFAQTLEAVVVKRLVNCCDVVTQVPPHTPWYVHVGPDTYIDRTGAVVDQPAAGEVLQDRAQARVSYLAEEAWKIGAVLLRDLADHSPINYARALFP